MPKLRKIHAKIEIKELGQVGYHNHLGFLGGLPIFIGTYFALTGTYFVDLAGTGFGTYFILLITVVDFITVVWIYFITVVDFTN